MAPVLPSSDDSRPRYAMTPQTAPVPAGELESETELAVEVTLSWGGLVLETRHFHPMRHVTVGTAVGRGHADFIVPETALDAEEQLLSIPMDGDSIIVDRQLLKRGDRTQLCLGALTLDVALLPAGKPTPRNLFTRNRDSWLSLAMVASLMYGLVATLGWLSPSLMDLPGEVERSARLRLMRQYMAMSADAAPAVEPRGETESPTSSDEGTRATGDEGSTGNLESEPRTVARAGLGLAHDAGPPLGPQDSLAEASSFGLIGLLGSALPSGPASAYARARALGQDHPLGAYGNMWNDPLADAFAAGGLGLVGPAEGGGASGERVIAVGDFGHGYGYGCGGCGGQSAGRIGGSHKTQAPVLRAQAPLVAGRLPASTIDRVVRQGFGPVRSCYAAALDRNPAAAGRIDVRFVINRDGAVTSSSGASESFPDAATTACVARSFYRLSFPKPDDGIVTVVYPIELAPT